MLVYKLTSPSEKFYFGKTLTTLEKRLGVHIRDRRRIINKNKPLSRFYSAWFKYPIETWKKEIIAELGTNKECSLLEIEMIAKFHTTNPDFGYNMAEGGNGGNTGRNGDKKKRLQHSIFMKKALHDNPNLLSAKKLQLKQILEELKQSPEKSLQRRIKISSATPRGKKHWNHTGLWVVNHNQYESSIEASQKEKINICLIQTWCNDPDRIIKKSYNRKPGPNVEFGKTRRECGFYRIKENYNDK